MDDFYAEMPEGRKHTLTKLHSAALFHDGIAFSAHSSVRWMRFLDYALLQVWSLPGRNELAADHLPAAKTDSDSKVRRALTVLPFLAFQPMDGAMSTRVGDGGPPRKRNTIFRKQHKAWDSARISRSV